MMMMLMRASNYFLDSGNFYVWENFAIFYTQFNHMVMVICERLIWLGVREIVEEDSTWLVRMGLYMVRIFTGFP